MTWKNTERAIARRLGGRRTSHRNLGIGAPDVVAGEFSVEVKHRKALPAWLTDGMAQARHYATDGQLALLVLHEAGRRHDGDMVVLRLDDFERWFGEMEASDDQEENQ